MDKYKSNINIFGDFNSSKTRGSKGVPDFSIPTKNDNSTLAKDLLPLHNKKDDRFQTDVLINGKTHFEETNTIIKSLEEELVTMKHKLSFIYEKDKEISKLKEQINQLKKDNKELQSSSQALIKLRLEHKQVTDQLDMISMKSHNNDKLLSENKLMRNKLKDLAKTKDDAVDDIADDTDSLFIEEIDDIDDIGDLDTESGEMMDINIPQLRSVLCRRLRDKQTKHIDNLIESYNLRKKNKIKKSTMEKMLEEAIHL